MFLKKYGYKKGIIFGLLLFSAGAFLFIPAANIRAFEVFLIGYFIIGFGLTFLETAANPYVTRLGDPEGATRRINLAQSFNGLAAAMGPAMGTIFILSGKEYSADEWQTLSAADQVAYLTTEASAVKIPYLIIALSVLAVAIIFMKYKFPEVADQEAGDEEDNGSIGGALKKRHLRWAVIAQFFYVGAQISFTSFFIRVAIKNGGLDEKTAGYYFSILWGVLFMAGKVQRYFFHEVHRPQQTTFLVCLDLPCIVARGNECGRPHDTDRFGRIVILYVDHVSNDLFTGHQGHGQRYKTCILSHHYVNHRGCHFPGNHGIYH